MKVRFASLAVLCILSLIACGGESEAELQDDVTLVESETVLTDTVEPILREADESDGTIVETDPDTPVSSEPSPGNTSPATSRPAEPAPAATTPASQTEPPVRAEPTPKPVTEPVRETETERSAPEATPTPEAEPAPAASSKLPKTHTVDQGGVMHAPGSDNPTKRCAACHGKDLKGGRAGVSCFDCHDKMWE